MSTPEPAPVCYRHPDRPTWIRCTRCDRPICPECMNAAPVGFQCPECVAAGQAAVREPRTVFGGRLTSSSTVTITLIGICVAIFVVQSLVGVNSVASNWGMWPAAVAVNDEWYRLLTSVFLHGSWLHLAFNMYVLYVLGPPLERLLGHGRFLALFLIAGLGGAVASFTFSSNTVSVRASIGAIFGRWARWLRPANARTPPSAHPDPGSCIEVSILISTAYRTIGLLVGGATFVFLQAPRQIVERCGAGDRLCDRAVAG